MKGGAGGANREDGSSGETDPASNKTTPCRVWQKLMEECLRLNKEEVTTMPLAVERAEICGSHWGAE